MPNVFTTRAGIEPCQKNMAFDVTTNDVQNYLQKKINVVLSKTNPELNGKVNVTVYTTEAGRKFVPFVVMLPKNVLDERVEEATKNLPKIYLQDGVEKNSTIKPSIIEVLKIYCYNKYDKEAFMSDDWRRRTQVSRSTAEYLKGMITPKLIAVGDNEIVQIIIDPIRVFYDMLKPEATGKNENNKEFYVEIEKWNRLKIGEYRYRVIRKAGSPSGKGKHGKNYKQIQLQELNAKFKNGR